MTIPFHRYVVVSHLEKRGMRDTFKLRFCFLGGVFQGVKLCLCVLFHPSLSPLGVQIFSVSFLTFGSKDGFKAYILKYVLVQVCDLFGNKTPSKLGEFEVISCHSVACANNHIQVFSRYKFQTFLSIQAFLLFSSSFLSFPTHTLPLFHLYLLFNSRQFEGYQKEVVLGGKVTPLV